jgi:hypothetical protein
VTGETSNIHYRTSNAESNASLSSRSRDGGRDI